MARNGRIWSLPRFGLVLLLLGCGGAGSDGPDPVGEQVAAETTSAESGPTVVRGMLVLGPEVRSLKPCDEETELWVIPIESVQEAYESLAESQYAPVFVEVMAVRESAPSTGFGADYSGQLRLTELRRAAPANEGFGCSEDLGPIMFRASGQEPFWHVRVSPDRIVLSTPEIPETVFEGASPARLDDGWRFESRSTGPEPLPLQLDLERGTCSDSMVGAIYSWTATLNVGGDVRTGCAWEGALSPGRS